MSKSKAEPVGTCRSTLAGAGSTTRRAMLGVAAAPLAGAPWTLVAAQGEMIALCAAWLAIDEEMDRQMTRWARLETLAGEAHDHIRLSPAERRVSAIGSEMDAIDRHIRELGRERQRRLEALGGMKPANIHDLAAQLSLAARILRDEDSDAGLLVGQAVAYLAGRCCPDCGAPCVAAGLMVELQT